MRRSFPWGVFCGKTAVLWVVALALVLLGLGMVGSEAADKPKGVPQLPEGVDIEEFLKPDPFTYDPAGKRDPFRSLTETRDWELTTKVGIERFDITELRLTGIVIGELGSFAMIEAPDKLTYFVGIDGTIGMNNGRIVEMDETSVTIEEPYTDDFGNPALRRLIMALEEAE